jgi:class 3 adenylate cyclase/tetratricopeptide (TPR) repeat protein
MVHEVRKTVTVVFCDVSGSTSMGERLDPETVRRVMTRYFEEMRSILEKHGGTVEKFIGDAVMAVFGIPTVHEDDALRAVRAASEMRTILDQLNEELERDHGVQIASRIGVNTGEVVAGERDTTDGTTLVTGDAVNVAARLEQAADPGSILIGDTTYQLVRDAVTVTSTEPLTVKGKAEPLPAFVLIEVASGVAGVARHLDAPIVGRAEELAMLEAALHRATLEPCPVLVTVLGPPGVGKSRLVDEFVAVSDANTRSVKGRCLSYGDGITYWPVIEMLTAAAGIDDMDGPDEIRAKVDGLLRGSNDAESVRDRLAEFLGLSGTTGAPEETHWAVRKLFEALASPTPLVVVVEDVHWAEPAMLDLIEYVLAWSANAPILLVCTARPDLLEQRADWGSSADGSVSIRLEPLTQEQTDELVVNLTGGTPLPPAAASIVGTAEGNPLFLEQLVGMLIDEGHLRRDDDAWIVVDDLSSLQVPPTITGILESRIERLPQTERDVLERGSIEGRVFHWGSVTALSTSMDSADVARDLLSLVRRGLVGAETALFGGGEAFRFRHALIRDAAYARMPKATRSDLHEQHARWLEEAAGDRIAEFDEFVAYHLEEAAVIRADLGPLDERGRLLAAEAAGRLRTAGLRAAGRGDHRAAVTFLERARFLLDPDDSGYSELLVRLASFVNEGGDPERAATVLDEAIELASNRGEDGIELRARLLRAQLETAIHPEGATEEFERLVTEAIPVLEELDDDEGLVVAWLATGAIGLLHGHAADMQSAFDRAALHAERADDQSNLGEALAYLIAVTSIGPDRPDDALAKIPRLRERKPSDRKVQAIALIQEGVALAELGRFDEARRRYGEGFDILEDLGARWWSAGARYSSGLIELTARDLTAAERELRRGIEDFRSMGERAYLSTTAALLGEVLYQQGRLDEAAEMAEQARQAGASDDISTQWQWRAVRAKVLARQDGLDEAVVLAEEAATITEQSDFLIDRAQSLVDLAEVYHLAGRREERARTLRLALTAAELKGVVPLIEGIQDTLASITD